MNYTVRVLGLTLLLAAPLPLVLAAAGWQLQTYFIWYPLIVGSPLALIALAWTGYVYDETRGLIRILMFTSTVVGLYLIWFSALPALHIFDDLVLWYGTVIVDGAEQPLPITLGNLGQALLFAIGTWVLADRLPALLEILLLQRFHMTAAGRYTLTTLTNYVVVAVGLMLVLGTLGARWSQVQWLAAALSVGIGFGLQEIVANFISGLIILFECPIRVGDAVTVGDTDGVVTKIKIRATTIRNWDGKELLVPNKN